MRVCECEFDDVCEFVPIAPIKRLSVKAIKQISVLLYLGLYYKITNNKQMCMWFFFNTVSHFPEQGVFKLSGLLIPKFVDVCIMILLVYA